MPAFAHRSARWGFALLIGAGLAACSSFDGASTRLASVVTPYKVDVVQGNFVSREQVEALQAGMGRQQVRDILGTPLVSSLFHADQPTAGTVKAAAGSQTGADQQEKPQTGTAMG